MELDSKVRLLSWLRKSSLVPVIFFVLVLIVSVPGSFSADLPNNYFPQIQILEIVSSPTNRTSTVNLFKERNSDVIIGEDTSAATGRILMKCNATYPVQWVYLGDGRPEFTTFTNVKWQEDPNIPLSFEAEASLGLLGFQGVLREEDTGNYTCRSIQEPTINSYYYIFVPGDNLFAAPNGTEITYMAKDQYARIPCGVSHPKASVTLCKKDKNKDKLNCNVPGASSFNTKGGFLINLKKQQPSQRSGTYVCTANFNGLVRIAEHHLMREDEKQKELAPAPAPPPPTFNTKPGANLCDPSPCGKQAECSVVNGRAVCYCFRGLNGNPYDECAPGKCRSSKECPRGKFCRQGQCTSNPCDPSPCGKGGECSLYRGQSKCSCSRGYTGLPPSCVKSCSRNEDCLEDEACIKAICQSPCPGPCGRNAECRVLINGAQRTAQCSCPNGFLGDPLKNCYKFNSTTPGPWNNCPPGYVGIPPACKRKECSSDLDCQFGRKCMKGICDNGGMPPECGGKCGVNAECVLSPTTSDPVCVCPSGTTGNPTAHCYSSQSPPTSFQTPSWGDPCNPNPCPSPAECHVIQGSRTCRCPFGFSGEPPNCVRATLPPSSAFPPSSSTGGTHVFCRFDGDCKPGENCVDGRCQDPCNGICGYNALCDPGYQRKYRSIFTTGKLVSSQQPPESSCICPPGHEGNPYVSCMPITYPGPPSSPALPSSTMPADPCFPNNPCGRFAECFPGNNAPVCRCRSGFEGNPYQECQESIFSPSPSADRTPLPRPTQGRATPVSPTELDYQGHSWGHHTGINTGDSPPPISAPPRREHHDSAGGSRFSSRPPPSPTMPQHTSMPYPPASPSQIYSHSEDPLPIDSVYPSYYPTSIIVEDTPTPKTLDPPMSPLDSPLIPPKDDRDECFFKNPYADYDMDSCGVGRRCERDFRGIKRCVCISPFDCTGPTSIYARNKCQSSRDCLLSEHICINGTCGNPCSPEFSPCAGIAFSECRVIEGNVLCTCRRGYVGSPASGLDCKPKRYPSSGSVAENDRNKYLLIHGGYHNASNNNNDFVINVSHEHNSGFNRTNSFNTTDYDSDNGSVILDDDGNDNDNDIIINTGTSGSGFGTSTRHHRRHNSNNSQNNNLLGAVDNKKITEGQCGFGSGNNCDERSHCRVVNQVPICVCKAGYRGEYPNCKPNCEKNEDCPENMACQYKQCMDPCIEESLYCANNAFCRIVNHTAACVCEPGYVGVPWIHCSKAENAGKKNDCMGFNCQKRKTKGDVVKV